MEGCLGGEISISGTVADIPRNIDPPVPLKSHNASGENKLEIVTVEDTVTLVRFPKQSIARS